MSGKRSDLNRWPRALAEAPFGTDRRTQEQLADEERADADDDGDEADPAVVNDAYTREQQEEVQPPVQRRQLMLAAGPRPIQAACGSRHVAIDGCRRRETMVARDHAHRGGCGVHHP